MVTTDNKYLFVKFANQLNIKSDLKNLNEKSKGSAIKVEPLFF